MDPEARRHQAQQAFIRQFRHVELPGGVVAMLTPESPQRSVFNSVVYDEPSAVVDGWDALARLYADAGVQAWTVWVRPADVDDLGPELDRRGHLLDATPVAMAMALDGADLDGPDAGEPAAWPEMARLNELAYGVPAGQFTGIPGPALSDALTIVGVPGEAVLGAYDAGGTATILFVATRPEAQGRGLATALMRQVLRWARGRGCTMSTLEATKAGQPVYERLGYESLGTMEMWEHRVTTS